MTMEDLREHGVLLPEEEWGTHRLETTVPEWPLAVMLLAAAVLWVVAYLGDGGTSTWIAIGGYLILVFAVTWICDRAVRGQRERFREERREAGEG
jgi:membrane protein implicated in regulation of membrane protease activity